jgi:hypothetical protein
MRYQFAAKYKVFLGMVVALLSPAFLLGINNALRQFWASIFLVYALYFYWKNKKITTFFFIIIATLFHYSSIVFGLFAVYIFYLTKQSFVSKVYFKHRGKLKFTKHLSTRLYFVLSFFAVFLFFPIALKAASFTKYSFYLNANFEGRLPLYSKYFYILISFLLTNHYIPKSTKIHDDFFQAMNMLRLSLLILVTPMNFFPNLYELGARVIYFYFVIEMFMLYLAIQKDRNVFATILLLINAFATNVWNVIGS